MELLTDVEITINYAKKNNIDIAIKQTIDRISICIPSMYTALDFNIEDKSFREVNNSNKGWFDDFKHRGLWIEDSQRFRY